MQSCFLFLCIQWRMSLHLPFLSTSKNHVSNVLQSCQSKTFFYVFFFNVTCIKILTHIFLHLYFLCISYVLQVYHCLFQKIFFYCTVLQAESCTNGTDCHEVLCFDDFYVACELGTCTCGGHGTVGMSLSILYLHTTKVTAEIYPGLSHGLIVYIYFR